MSEQAEKTPKPLRIFRVITNDLKKPSYVKAHYFRVDTESNCVLFHVQDTALGVDYEDVAVFPMHRIQQVEDLGFSVPSEHVEVNKMRLPPEGSPEMYHLRGSLINALLEEQRKNLEIGPNTASSLYRSAYKLREVPDGKQPGE